MLIKVCRIYASLGLSNLIKVNALSHFFLLTIVICRDCHEENDFSGDITMHFISNIFSTFGNTEIIYYSSVSPIHKQQINACLHKSNDLQFIRKFQNAIIYILRKALCWWQRFHTKKYSEYLNVVYIWIFQWHRWSLIRIMLTITVTSEFKCHAVRSTGPQ